VYRLLLAAANATVQFMWLPVDAINTGVLASLRHELGVTGK
jgi:hypothetical protein